MVNAKQIKVVEYIVVSLPYNFMGHISFETTYNDLFN